MLPGVEEKFSSNNLCSETKMIQDFCTNMKLSDDSKNDDVKEDESGETDSPGDDVAEEKEEEEFSFVCEGAISSPIAAEDAFINGQIKPAFPLFNRDSLFPGEDSNALQENLPKRPPVKKVFVETREEHSRVTSSKPENGKVAGLHRDLSNGKAVEASPQVCKKSNSTGFSKIWRFKGFLGRSNSDGRDAFVFLNNGQAAEQSASATAVKGEDKGGKKESTEKVKGKTAKKKGRTASLSAHEAYLRSKAKDDRRRSYLPYRRDVMGFFTNVNGGLTKNVHPF